MLNAAGVPILLKKTGSIENVSDVDITIENGVLTLECDSSETLVLVKRTLRNIGYPERGQENTLGSKTKSYVRCEIGKMKS